MDILFNIVSQSRYFFPLKIYSFALCILDNLQKMMNRTIIASKKIEQTSISIDENL